MTDIMMPAGFPETDFRAFGVAARAFFPAKGSKEAMFDPQQKLAHFQHSWQAVRYRYRSCAECNDDFKQLRAKASQPFKKGWSDEELLYRFERCIYLFFMSGLSVFDSFAFCLYFYGNALQPDGFPLISTPKKIDRKRTGMAFQATFPSAALTGLVFSLQSDPMLTTNDARFVAIDTVRNLVGHRISGRRSVLFSSGAAADGSYRPGRKESWHLPGAAGPMIFDEEMLQRHLDDIRSLLASLSSAAREFAVERKAARKPFSGPQS